MFAKIKLYIAIGIASVIIGLLIFIGIQYIRIQSLEKNVDTLKIENKKVWQDYDFAQKQIEIQNQFTNSTEAIETITNEIIFSSNKQIVIDKIISDFYRRSPIQNKNNKGVEK